MKTNPHVNRSRQPSRAPAFTLIEILVTIAIIMVLAVLGVIVAKSAMEKTQQTKSISAMRAVASANMQYATDNNSQINTLKWEGDPEEGRPFVGNSFWGRLTPYLFDHITTNNQGQMKSEIKQSLNQLFSTSNCDKMTGTWLAGSKIYHDSSGLPVPFAFNDELYTWNEWVRTNQVPNLAEIMYITYGFGIFNEADGKSFTPRPTDGSKPENNIYYLENGKAAVAFLDGHVEMLSPPIPRHFFSGEHR
jgi:prepilin-type processing-associated H-X9-DG protein